METTKSDILKTGTDLFGRALLALVIIAVMFLAPFAEGVANSATKKSFPNKKITWIVPYSPGGGYDTYARAIARVFSKYLPKKVNVIVRNIPGAGSMTGSIALSRAEPDGHTIGILTLQGMAISPILRKKTVLDPSEFIYLGAVIRDPGSLLVAANSPFRSLQDLQKAQTVKFGATGPPSTSWIAPKLAGPILKIPVEIVTGYKGSTEYFTGMIRGDVDAAYNSVGSAVPFIKAGEIRPIILFRKSELQPNAPVIEEGSPYEEMRLVGEDRVVAAPPGVPREIADILEDALMKSMKDKEVQDWSSKTGYLLTPYTGEEVTVLADKLIKMYQKYQDILR